MMRDWHLLMPRQRMLCHISKMPCFGNPARVTTRQCHRSSAEHGSDCEGVLLYLASLSLKCQQPCACN